MIDQASDDENYNSWFLAVLTMTSPKIESLPHGAVLMRHALSEQEQEQIARHCFRYRSPRDAEYDPANSMYTPLLAWMYPGEMFKLYQDRQRERDEPDLFDPVSNRLQHTVDQLLLHHQQQHQTYNPPQTFQPRCLRAILYPRNGRLHAHQDMFMGWVTSVSLGASCDFFYGPSWDDDAPDRCVVRLNSGDVLLVNGQALPHGVDKCYDDHVPAWWQECWRDGTVPQHWSRLNIQARHMA